MPSKTATTCVGLALTVAIQSGNAFMPPTFQTLSLTESVPLRQLSLPARHPQESARVTTQERRSRTCLSPAQAHSNDRGHTHGYAVSGRQLANGNNPVSVYMHHLEHSPLATKMATSAVICAFGDLLAQTLNHADASGDLVVDVPRMLMYGVVGGAYTAPLVHVWFGALEGIFGGAKQQGVLPARETSAMRSQPLDAELTMGAKLTKAAKMVALDQSLGACVCNAGFIFLFTFLTTSTSSGSADLASLAGYHKVEQSLWPTMLMSWKIWPMVNMVNFAFVPPHLRVLFMNVIGVAWNVMLSNGLN